MAHTCHAIDCNANVPPEMLMCKQHWFKVPQHLRARVWATYRPGQCDDQRPSKEYCAAARAAVEAVAKSEGIKYTQDHPALRLYDFFAQNAS